MKALIHSKYGNPRDIFQFNDVDKPRPEENEVLVKVHATTVNRTDEGLTSARYFVSRFFTGLSKPRKQIPGTDFAGQVEDIGAQVTSFKIGDRIFGFNDEILNSHAEYLTIAENKAITQIPDGIKYTEAAACCEGAHYAVNFISKVKLGPGAKVLVNGATGAIGTAAVQLLKYYGAEITAVANTKNLALIKDLGANEVIDYTKDDFTRTQDKYDFVFDAVGKSSFRKCKPLLKNKGIYISSELGWRGSNIFLALFTPIFGGKKVIFPIPTDIKKSLQLIKKLMGENKFTAVIDRTVPFSQIIEAYEYVQQGQKTGNVVITMQPDS